MNRGSITSPTVGLPLKSRDDVGGECGAVATSMRTSAQRAQRQRGRHATLIELIQGYEQALCDGAALRPPGCLIQCGSDGVERIADDRVEPERRTKAE